VLPGVFDGDLVVWISWKGGGLSPFLVFSCEPCVRVLVPWVGLGRAQDFPEGWVGDEFSMEVLVCVNENVNVQVVD